MPGDGRLHHQLPAVSQGQGAALPLGRGGRGEVRPGIEQVREVWQEAGKRLADGGLGRDLEQVGSRRVPGNDGSVGPQGDLRLA